MCSPLFVSRAPTTKKGYEGILFGRWPIKTEPLPHLPYLLLFFECPSLSSLRLRLTFRSPPPPLSFRPSPSDDTFSGFSVPPPPPSRAHGVEDTRYTLSPKFRATFGRPRRSFLAPASVRPHSCLCAPLFRSPAARFFPGPDRLTGPCWYPLLTKRQCYRTESIGISLHNGR